MGIFFKFCNKKNNISMKRKITNNSVFSSGSWVPDNSHNYLSNLENSYKIYIKDLILPALIGIHPHEKDKRQKISINIELTTPDNKNHFEDNIENVVSYENIVKNIKTLIDIGHVGLLETLADKISEICFNDQRVIDAKIKIEKLEVFKETSSVGIEIFRRKHPENLEKKKIYRLQK